MNDDYEDARESGHDTQALDGGEKRSTQQMAAVNDSDDAPEITTRPDRELASAKVHPGAKADSDKKIIDFSPAVSDEEKVRTRGIPLPDDGNVLPDLDDDPEESRDSTPTSKPPLPRSTSATGESRSGMPDTAILNSSNERLRQKLAVNSIQGTASLGDKREIIFVIRSMVERFVLTEATSVLLGRNEPGSRPENNMIDLTPYGALDRGVSRQHVRLHLKDNYLYVTDLGSTNGTFLAGKRLRPNEPALLHKGDELLLGRLAVQVLFR